MGQPAYYKNNPATRAFERVQQLRAELGTRADRGLPPAIVEAEAVVDVRNAPLGADGLPLPVVSTLSPEQIQARMLAWQQETGQVLDSNNNIATPDVDEDIPASDPGEQTQAPVIARGGTYRWPAPTPPPQYGPRAIDFSKMQSINPTEGVVVVDGISFNMSASEKQAAALLMANIVQRAMQDQLLAGLKALGLVEAQDAPVDTVPGMPEEGTGVVPSADDVLQVQEPPQWPCDVL